MSKACKLGCVVHLDSLNMFMSGQNLKVKLTCKLKFDCNSMRYQSRTRESREICLSSASDQSLTTNDCRQKMGGKNKIDG